MPIEIIHQDITTLNVDAIVNAANTSLLGGGGVDGAIHAKAGPLLLETCKQLHGRKTGGAKITPGFNLPAKWIIHAVGPVWQGGQVQEAQLLQSCYQQAFKIAKEYAIKTIAFPAISTGIYGYPKAQAAQIALTEMIRHQKDFQSIIACLFSNEDKALYEKILISL